MRVKGCVERQRLCDGASNSVVSWPNFDHKSELWWKEHVNPILGEKSHSCEGLCRDSDLDGCLGHGMTLMTLDCNVTSTCCKISDINRRSRSLPLHYVERTDLDNSLEGEATFSTKSIVRQKEGVSPHQLKERLDTIVSWFCQFDDEQKNLTLKALLSECGPSQNHCLSVAMETRFHQLCPPNCQDLLSWLPEHLALYIFSYFDAVTLARCAQVCRDWRQLANTSRLWHIFCRNPKWQLSLAGETRQRLSFKLRDGGIDWKRCFVERFRLRRNWLKGTCHVRTFEGHTQCITCVQFDETRIVSGSSDKTIKVWNIRTNSPWSVMTLVGHSGTVRCLHLEGSRLVSGSSDCTIKVWDLSTQLRWSSIACKVTMVGHTDTVRCLQADDGKVVSGSYDHTLKVWKMSTGECMYTLIGHSEAVLCVQFDSAKIISGSCDKSIKIWNLENGSCTATLHGHQDAVTCLQFDDVRILSGSLDRTIKFWSLDSGLCLRTLDWMSSEGHTGVVRCLQADSWRFVSGGDDKTLKVWSLETGQRLITLRNHTDGVTCLQFNDYIIVSGSYDKTVKLWDFSVC